MDEQMNDISQPRKRRRKNGLDAGIELEKETTQVQPEAQEDVNLEELFDDELLEDFEDDFEDEYYDDEEDMDFYEVECPGCNEKVYFDEDMINDEVLVCPNCNEKIEIEFDEDVE